MINYRIYVYHLTRLIRLLVKKIIRLLSGETSTDDFDWNIYSVHYRGELADFSKRYTQILHNDDYVFKDNHLLINNDILPLHPNHSLLYETILQLAPSSILELGCGGGDHLHNINILSPNTEVSGIDLSSAQISLFKERHPALKIQPRQFDITLPLPPKFGKVDIAFTQAVIMHIHAGNGHLVALTNLFQTASKQVILMEDWKRHNFMDDICKLHSLEIITWTQLFFYFRVSEELGKPHLMIISSVPLNQYPILSNYKILLDNA